ncbi:MAG TPA: lysoplasmalogenase [Methylomirabilota bacterium]|nr:lysoplasmalogenase [Methylomirabilota bacterium]
MIFGRLRHFDGLDRSLLLLSIASSAAYAATRAVQPFHGSVLIKALAIAPLAVLAARVLSRAQRPRDARLLTAALALSCVGDVFLHLDARRYFVHALGAFLLAHLAYVALFVSNWPRPLRLSAGQIVSAALVVVYGVVMCAWLWTGLGRLRVPALAYAAAIVAMTVSTILAGFSRPYVAIGALLFLLSDSLIAAGRFKLVVPLAALLIWPTYYLGQYAIAVGFLREKTLRG